MAKIMRLRPKTKQIHGWRITKANLTIISLYSGELFLAMVTSREAHAKILRIDLSAASSMPGVKGIVTHEDVGNNIHNGAEIIASKMVRFNARYTPWQVKVGANFYLI